MAIWVLLTTVQYAVDKMEIMEIVKTSMHISHIPKHLYMFLDFFYTYIEHIHHPLIGKHKRKSLDRFITEDHEPGMIDMLTNGAKS